MNRPNQPRDEHTSIEILPEGDSQEPSGEPSPNPATATSDVVQRLQEAESRALRIQADLENFRRRTRREVDEQLKYASLPLITDLIEVVDNLSRALGAADTDSSRALIDGVRMVLAQLEQVLEKNGCRRIPSVHMAFDPNIHSATEMRFSENVPANIVIAETRSGYQLQDRVVRPAHVVVSKGPAV